MKGINITIDEIGRIVIPKAFRKRIGINSRDVLNLTIEDDSLIIKKSEDSDIIQNSLNKYIIPFAKKFDVKVFVTNLDKVVYTSKKCDKILLEQAISEQLKIIFKEDYPNASFINYVNITDNYKLEHNCYYSTLNNKGHVIGIIIAQFEKKNLIM